MREKLYGIIKYIVESMKLADKANLKGYVNRLIYRKAIYDERFELKPKSPEASMLFDVAIKKNCPPIHTQWYGNRAREYRTLNIGNLYGISLLEYYTIPNYIRDMLVNDAMGVKERENAEARSTLSTMGKSNALFSEKELNKLR